MSNTVLYSGLILLGTFIASISQVLLKKAALKKHDNKIKEYLNPLVIIAYILFFITTLVGPIAYKYVPISLGPILESSSYIYITIFGIVIFKEKMNKQRIIGLLLIVTGIIVYSIF